MTTGTRALMAPLALTFAVVGCSSSRPPATRPTASRSAAEVEHAHSQPSHAHSQPSHAHSQPSHAHSQPSQSQSSHERTPIELVDERRLKNVRMLTDGGENAEAYWSFDGTRLIFQAKRGDMECDHIMTMQADGTDETIVAATGAHTCAFYLAGDERIIYASTRGDGGQCPTPPDRSRGYVWAIFESHDIYSARPDGTEVRQLTDTPGYDAEATVGPDGRVVFTSVRDGDLEIYTMNGDGSDVRRLTETPGYDGGPFFSPDGTKIVYRASHPTDPEVLAEYRALLAEGLVRPSRMEIWVMNSDGSDAHQVTELGRAAFAPVFTPDGEHILFASNHLDPQHRNFDLFLIGLDGGTPERVTFNASFDSFPMFSPDGTKLAFCSNRGNSRRGETNVFVADWVASP